MKHKRIVVDSRKNDFTKESYVDVFYRCPNCGTELIGTADFFNEEDYTTAKILQMETPYFLSRRFKDGLTSMKMMERKRTSLHHLLPYQKKKGKDIAPPSV